MINLLKSINKEAAEIKICVENPLLIRPGQIIFFGQECMRINTAIKHDSLATTWAGWVNVTRGYFTNSCVQTCGTEGIEGFLEGF